MCRFIELNLGKQKQIMKIQLAPTAKFWQTEPLSMWPSISTLHLIASRHGAPYTNIVTNFFFSTKCFLCFLIFIFLWSTAVDFKIRLLCVCVCESRYCNALTKTDKTETKLPIERPVSVIMKMFDFTVQQETKT